jgi:DNA-binding MurR/RpiR family transcriptional regulator
MRAMKSSDDIRAALSKLATGGTPALSSFALWLLDNLHEAAFSSIRGLANTAGVNPNTVTRLARELGYDGFDAFRRDVRRHMHPSSYGDRARALRNLTSEDVYAQLVETGRSNMERVFSDAGLAEIDACVEPLLQARQVYAVGVRSCFSVAHYFTYVGGMAFENFVQGPAMPGAILDQISKAGPEDVVVAITYQHYSAEVVRACQVARDNEARVLALTDTYSSPIALDAWKVLRLPMAGPQLMPSLSPAFMAIEILLAAMAARSDGAADRVARFEDRLKSYGGYVAPGTHPNKKG